MNLNASEASTSILECIDSITKLSLKNAKVFDINIVREMAQTAELLSKQLYKLYDQFNAEKEATLVVQELSMLELSHGANEMSHIESSLSTASDDSRDSHSNLLFSEHSTNSDSSDAKTKTSCKLKMASEAEKIVKVKDAQSFRLKRLCSFRRSFLNKVFFKADA